MSSKPINDETLHVLNTRYEYIPRVFDNTEVLSHFMDEISKALDEMPFIIQSHIIRDLNNPDLDTLIQVWHKERFKYGIDDYETNEESGETKALTRLDSESKTQDTKTTNIISSFHRYFLMLYHLLIIRLNCTNSRTKEPRRKRVKTLYRNILANCENNEALVYEVCVFGPEFIRNRSFFEDDDLMKNVTLSKFAITLENTAKEKSLFGKQSSLLDIFQVHLKDTQITTASVSTITDQKSKYNLVVLSTFQRHVHCTSLTTVDIPLRTRIRLEQYRHQHLFVVTDACNERCLMISFRIKGHPYRKWTNITKNEKGGFTWELVPCPDTIEIGSVSNYSLSSQEYKKKNRSFADQFFEVGLDRV